MVKHNGQRAADIYLESSFWNRTCGLCGTFDGNPDNDWTGADGVVRQTVSIDEWLSSQLVCFCRATHVMYEL